MHQYYISRHYTPPFDRTSALEQLPGRQFDGLLKDFIACKDLPVMLLTNIAPKFGLYNGARCYFHGLLYLPDDVQITMTKQDFMNLKIKNLLTQQPHDVNVQGNASHARFHQLPVNAKLTSVDSLVVSTDDEVHSAIRHKQSFTCSFTLPNSPPALPDFIVLRCDA